MFNKYRTKHKQKKEITSLKRKIVELEEEVFTNNKRYRLDSDDIIEDENIKKKIRAFKQSVYVKKCHIL